MTVWLALLVIVPMMAEARVAARHDRALRATGAVEPAGDVYGIMRVAYPACFVAMIAEGWLRPVRIGDWTLTAGLLIFAAAKGLKYWAIATLGERWTFRVLVPPGATRIVRGPYRRLRHPNYVAVAGEMIGMGLMAHAPVAALASVAGFGGLMAARIRIEEQAMGRDR